MSAFLIGIASIGMLSLLLLVLPLFAWPDITIYLVFFNQIINYFFFFNPIFPVDTLFTILVIVLTIELSLFLFRLFTKIMSFVTGAGFDHK